MVAFIARMIERQAKISTEKGQAKYRAYFIKTKIYEEFRPEVEAILIQDGYADVIVTE